MLINGVSCDTFAHVDRKLAGETVFFNLNGRRNFFIVVYLYVDGKPFPVSSSLTAECCVKDLSAGENKSTISASIGTGGEIIVPLPVSFRIDGKNLLCEINISGTDVLNRSFRYKASNFRVSVIE